jgi:hypothetical protein
MVSSIMTFPIEAFRVIHTAKLCLCITTLPVIVFLFILVLVAECLSETYLNLDSSVIYLIIL